MRNFMFRLIGLPVIALAMSSGAFAAGDAVSGYETAKTNCARCHDIDKGAGFKLMPPSFQSIAIYRTAEDIWSRIIAPSPHRGMPDTTWTITPDEVQDLVAYITSLDTPVSLPAQ
jgi:mono/diheme cytochrome c family protein